MASIDSCEIADGGVFVVSAAWKNKRRTSTSIFRLITIDQSVAITSAQCGPNLLRFTLGGLLEHQADLIC